MTGIDHTREALQELKAADDALSPASETFRVRRAYVHAMLAQSRPGTDGVLDMAWRVHDTAAGSIGKADAKAGFVATVNGALLAGVLTIAHLDRLGTLGRFLVGTGGVLMVAAVLLAVAVVLPVLRARQINHTAPGNLLYFGAFRNSTPEALADRLRDEDAVREICAQSIALARLSWLKHRLLQLSLIATITGTNLVGWTLLLAGGAR